MYSKLANCCFVLMDKYQEENKFLHLLFRILDILAENSPVSIEELLKI